MRYNDGLEVIVHTINLGIIAHNGSHTAVR